MVSEEQSTDRSADSHRIAGAADLAPGDLRLVEIAGRRLCLARAEDEQLYAVDDTCSHEDESLSDGWLDGMCVECPAHNSMFDLRTGQAQALPAVEPVRTYPVRVDGDDVVIDVPVS